MANSEDLKSSAEKLEGSSPSSGTICNHCCYQIPGIPFDFTCNKCGASWEQMFKDNIILANKFRVKMGLPPLK